MESLRFLLKYVMFWSAVAAVSAKVTESDTKNDIQNKETDENMDFVSPFVVPAPMSYYGFQYPILVPGLFMFN